MKLRIAETAPFFSIVLTTYERAHLVANAIESVLAQSFSDWELLIIDDGSRDNTLEVVRPFLQRDARIRYHYSQNRGPALVRNVGAQMSIAEYITFLDSDDRYRQDHLAVRAEYLRMHPEVELLHGGVEVIGPDTVADKDDPSHQIALTDCVIGGTFVIHRSLLERLGGFAQVEYSDDSDFFARAEQTGAVIHKIDTPTYIYNRLEPDSLCSIASQSGIAGIRAYRGL